MATTSPDNIQYPVNSDQVAPLASHFKNIADSTQAALNNKPDTLDLPDVIEKLNNLDYAQFDTTYAGGSTAPGMLAWDADNETLQFQLDPHVTLQVGQEHVIRVKNASGSVAIPNGTVVMFAGAAGDTVTVSPAVSDGSISINYLVGLTTEEIPADGFGFVTQLGFVNGVNTNSYNVGDILYPNPAVPGGLTATEPEAPNWKIPIAAVTKKNASSGRLLVRAIGGGGGGGASVTVEETAPSVAAPGDLWLDSTDGTLYVYYEDVDGNQWIQVQANSALGASIESRLGALESQAIAYGNQNPNMIINGGMDVAQRNTTHANAPSNQYFIDRWYGRRTANAGNIDFTRQASSLPGIPFCVRYQRTSGTTSVDPFEFMQTLETANSVLLQGKIVTFSFYARAGANFSASGSNISFGIYSGTGTDQNLASGFTGQATVAVSTSSINTSWQRFTVTGAVGNTITGVGVRIFWTPVGTAGAADFVEITGAQLEQGSTATSFRRNGNSLQEELANCQRYYQVIASGDNSFFATGHGFSTVSVFATYTFPVQLRASGGTATISSAAHFRTYSANGSGIVFTALSVESVTPQNMRINGTVAAGLTVGQAAILSTQNSSAFFAISAEL